MSDNGRDNDLGRISRRPYRKSGLDRQTRLTITLAVAAVLVLLLGVGLGFALGRATAPEPEQPPIAQSEETTLPVGVVEEVPAETIDPDLTAQEEVVSEEEVADEEPPPTPTPTSPKDDAVIDASRVDLRWSEVEDDSQEPVTYAFEIQDRSSSNGTYGNTQVISDLKAATYSARVLSVKRRWRVWSVDAAGNKSDKSGWRYYIHKATPKAKSTPKPSDETT